MMHRNPYLPAGTVYGTLLSFRREWELWVPRMHEAPHRAPPRAPVLYVKTANTFTPSGRIIPLSAGVESVEVGPTLGLVAGAGGVPVACALFNDVSLPHESYYRPPVRYRCVDGFLGVGAQVRPIAELGGLEALARVRLTLRMDSVVRQQVALADLVRDARTLWAEVHAFQTLQPGDVLLLGTDCLPDGTRLRARAGTTVEILADGFTPLVNTFAWEARP
jgi:5-oxopent-3-ene-1,2,5-tricarboxylate decarboxylase/2-hydroxyhepta-2,4-diene-1,7-dioate isomerase